MRAPARDDERVRTEIAATLDEVTPQRRQAFEGADGRLVPRGRPPRSEVPQEHGPRRLARTEKDGVCVLRRFVGQRRRMKPSEADVDAARPIGVGNRVRTFRRGDVDGHDDEVRVVVQRELLDVLVDELDLVVVIEISGKSGQPERRKQRVLDRAIPGRVRLEKSREDHLDAQRTTPHRRKTLPRRRHCRSRRRGFPTLSS